MSSQSLWMTSSAVTIRSIDVFNSPKRKCFIPAERRCSELPSVFIFILCFLESGSNRARYQGGVDSLVPDEVDDWDRLSAAATFDLGGPPFKVHTAVGTTEETSVFSAPIVQVWIAASAALFDTLVSIAWIGSVFSLEAVEAHGDIVAGALSNVDGLHNEAVSRTIPLAGILKCRRVGMKFCQK